MKRIKIFLRLKAREIWKFLCIATMVLAMAILIMVAIASFFGTIAFLVDTAKGVPIHLFEVLSIMVTVPTLSCFMAIVTKRWLQSNWELAGRIAEREE